MNFRNRGSVWLACLLVAMPQVSAATPQGSAVASDCSQLVDDIQRETRAFHSEAQQFGSKFVRDEAIDGVFDAFGKRLDGLDASDPVSAASKGFREAEEAGKRLQSWDERLKRWGETVSGYMNCTKIPAACSIADWIKDHEIFNKEFTDWLKSFGGEPLEKTTERVEKASEFLKSYTAKVGSTATGTMASAAKCMADYSPRSQSASGQEPAPIAQPPAKQEPAPTAQTPAKDASPPKKGMSPVARVGLATGAVLGGLYLGKYVADQYATLDGDTGGSAGMTLEAPAVITCIYNAGGVLSNCSGNILVKIDNKVAAGSTLRLNGAAFGGNRTISTSLPGSINFFLTGGAGGTSCPGPVTSLALLNLSVSTSTVIASAGGFTIPVTCR